jgi:signal transduction histidine kinase
MGMIRSPEVKRLYKLLGLLLAVFLCLTFLFSQWKACRLSVGIADNISAAVGMLAERFPEAEAEIMEQIGRADQGSIQAGQALLKRYGYSSHNILFEIESMQRISGFNAVLSILFLFAVCIVLIIIFSLFLKSQYTRIREVTNYARLVQSKDYSLDIRDNSEGDISMLKNEIYKITTMLREQAEVLQKDKLGLSNSIADISHQLKTPLTSLFVLNDLLAENPDPGIKKEFLQRIESQLERMQWLVSSLLKLSKLDAGTVVMKKEAVSARTLTERALESLKIQIEQKDIQVLVGSHSGSRLNSGEAAYNTKQAVNMASDMDFTGDFNWTLEALINILKNCVEHTPTCAFKENKMLVKFKKGTSLTLSVILIAAMLTGLLAACSVSDIIESDLVINEVVTSNTNSLSVPGLGSPDWVEIYNRSKNDINLNGYILRNSSKPSTYYVFPDIVIQAGEYLVVYACSKPKEDEIRILCTDFNLSKDGVGLVLYDSNLKVLDEVEVPALETDMSWSRTEKGFKYCTTPTPRHENSGTMLDSLDELTADPGTLSPPSGLRLNEVTTEWVEIYNGSQDVVNLSSYCLSDNASNLAKWRFPDVELLPDEYLLVGLDNGVGDYSASFGISSTDEAVYFSAESNVIGSFQVSNLSDNLSIGLDSSGSTAYFPDVTPGGKNSDVCFYSLETSPMTDDNPVRISEVLLRNAYSLVDEYGDRSPWVELHNDSDQSVDLSFFYLSDTPENLTKWRLPKQQLEPGEFIVIFLSGQDAELHTSFRVSSEEPVILTDFTTNQTQVIDIPKESRLDNVSFGEQDGSWLYFGHPTPNAENTSHGSMSISSVEHLDRSGVWINEVSAAARPRANALGLDGRNWIELYNGGDREVSLAGWHLGKNLDDRRLAIACP